MMEHYAGFVEQLATTHLRAESRVGAEATYQKAVESLLGEDNCFKIIFVSHLSIDRVRNNMRPLAIFHAFQPYDRPSTCLPGHNGHPECTHLLLLFFIDYLSMCLMSILVSLLTHLFDDLFPTVTVMTNTSLTAEWPPKFV